nr:MAG TPA: hypothetical protein [Caudoviricetes sp.]DAX39215.1 MAG TPA: hypothetical protein [Caudoviricetes sp.]
MTFLYLYAIIYLSISWKSKPSTSYFSWEYILKERR